MLSSTLCKIGDLVIDGPSRIVKRGGRNITLTPRELAILEMLVERPGQVVSRTSIWERLYDEVDWQSSNLIDVYICRLRQKIDQDFSVRRIRTKRGKGYYLLSDESV